MVDVIDTALHTTTFPAGYTGPGTLIGNPKHSSVAKEMSIFFTSTGNAVAIPLGFEPLRIKVVNDTDGVTWEWFRGMAATHSIKNTSATDTADDTTSGIVVSGDFAHGNCLLTISAAAAGSAKTIAVNVAG